MPNRNQTGKTTEQLVAELLEEHGPVMSRAAQAITRRRQDAEDCVQTILLRLLISGIPEALWENPAAYLCSSAIHEAYKVIRAADRRHIDSNVDVFKLTQPMSRAGPDYEVSMTLKKAVESLEEKDALILIWHDLEGYTHAEIAKKTGQSEMAVAKALLRIRERVRAIIEHSEATEKRSSR